MKIFKRLAYVAGISALLYFSGIGFGYTTHKPKPIGWTDEQDDFLYNVVYHQADSVMERSEQKKEISGCVVNFIKSKYPNGVDDIKYNSIDSLRKSAFDTCYSSLKDTVVLKWTQAVEDRITANLIGALIPKSKNPDVTLGLCKCMVANIKGKHFYGIKGEIKESEYVEAAKECRSQLR